MKKLIAIALVSLGAVAASADRASAFFHCLCYKKCFSYQINIRPYNAFSPCCFGQIYCDGCAPPQYPIPGYMGHGGPGAQPMPAAQPAPAMGAPKVGMPLPPQAPYGMMPNPMQPNPYMMMQQPYAPGYPPALPASRIAPGMMPPGGQGGF